MLLIRGEVTSGDIACGCADLVLLRPLFTWTIIGAVSPGVGQ